VDRGADIQRSVEQYASVVTDVFSPKEIILYGSHAKGNAREDSDIDVAVIFERFTGDYLGAIQKLQLLCYDIDTRIEPILLEESDDPSGLIMEVKRTGRIIYQSRLDYEVKQP